MANYYPPNSIYPKSYDSNYNLFLVYNTSETITVTETLPWAEEISIKPVAENDPEIWAENGFANINGELFYYDSVEYYEYSQNNKKVCKFKRCARNLGGTETQYNPIGAEVRGFVIAEHHNQLTEAILNIQGFIGENFTENQKTLDWKIRNLNELPIIFDDYTCPDVTFSFIYLENNSVTGILVEYNVIINGVYNGFKIDFGDGSSETGTTTGQHRYSINAIIDPIITITTDKCTIIQSPIERIITTEPKVEDNENILEIKIPNIPNLPQVIIPDIILPNTTIQPPPKIGRAHV